jgi:anaerobic selenocysteine-containing dehydrogenase
MINVMISEEIYDRDFVDKWCYGFEELAERVSDWTPEKAERVTWVPAEKIVRTARKLAGAKNFIIQWGVAVDMTKEAIPTNQAVLALCEITGNIDRPGSMIAPVSVMYYAGGWGKELISIEQDDKRIGKFKYALLSKGFTTCSTDELIKTLETDEPYKMHGAWLQTTNFLACAGPDPKRTLKAYANLDFITAVDLFMTPTIMALADIVLPAATFPERYGVRCGDGLQRGEVMLKACSVGECKSDMEINLAIGKRLNPEAWPWENDIDMFNTILSQTGISFDEMRDAMPVYIPFEYYRYEKGLLRSDGKPGFNTPTGRIELWSIFYAQSGMESLPYFEEPESPYSRPDLAEEYPLILTTGARTIGFFHSEHRQIPRLRAMHPWPIIEVHPQMAKQYGLQNGDWVWVENHRGRCKRQVEVSPILSDPRIVSTDHAWWYPEAPGSVNEGLFGLWDLACNNLIPYEPGRAGKGCNYKSFMCKIYRVERGDQEWDVRAF